MAIVTESYIENKAVRKFEDLGFIYFKLNNPASSGWPDRQFISPWGPVFFIEFKAPDEQPRPLQLFRIQTLVRCKQTVYLVDDTEQIEEILEYERNSRMGTPPVSTQSSDAYDSTISRWIATGSRIGEDE